MALSLSLIIDGNRDERLIISIEKLKQLSPKIVALLLSRSTDYKYLSPLLKMLLRPEAESFWKKHFFETTSPKILASLAATLSSPEMSMEKMDAKHSSEIKCYDIMTISS